MIYFNLFCNVFKKKHSTLWWKVLYIIIESGMIETHQNPKVCLISKFFLLLNTCYFPFCWSLILCYQLIKNRTGGIGTETSHFRLVGCLEVWSCLNWIFICIFNTKSSWWCLI